jgi:transposase-like protein
MAQFSSGVDRTVAKTAIDLDIKEATIYAWIKQDRVDRGEIPGCTTEESKETRRAKRRIRRTTSPLQSL